MSKLIMAQFYYDVLKPHYGENIKLLYTDTDSFIFHVLTDDLYIDMKHNMKYLDTCDYPLSHMLHSNINKKVM